MKPLITYIEESRETVGNLPFTRQQFRWFLKAAADYKDDDPIYIAVGNAITKKYGKKVWNGFKGWCEGSHYNSDPDGLYDILINLPKDRLARILGAGSFGVAIEMTNGMVCKIYHRNTPMERSDRKFYEYCRMTKSNVFPKVYKLSDNYVVMEKLKMNTPKCKKWDEHLGFNAKPLPGTGLTLGEVASEYVNGTKRAKMLAAALPDDIKEIFDWAVDALTHLKKAVGWDTFGDMKLANIGERSDGSIIWFDI